VTTGSRRRHTIKTLLIVAMLTLSFHLRYYSSLRGSPILSGFGVNIDWTRHDIVQTHQIGVMESAKTDIASWSGNQAYDIGSILYASLNIVTGTTELVEGLRLLDALPILPFAITPLLALAWYRRTARWEGRQPSDIHHILLIALALCLSANFIIRTARGYHTANLARVVLICFLFAIARAPSDNPKTRKRFSIIALIFALTMANMYHTWVFYFAMLLITIIVVDLVVERIDPPQPPWNTPPYGVLFLAGLLFVFVGVWINHRFEELALTAVNTFLFSSTGDMYFSASSSEYVRSTVDDALMNLNLRRIVTIVGYLASGTIIGAFVLGRLHHGRTGLREGLGNKYEKILLTSLPMFVLMIGSMVAYGMTPIARVESVGIYWVMFIGATILAQRRRSVPIVKLCMALIVISAVFGAVMNPNITEPRHTSQEGEAIQFSGQYLDKTEPVFSDAHLAPPLTYYDHTSVVVVRVTYENWEEYLGSIYFGESAQAADNAIQGTIEDATFGSNPETEDYSIIFSGSPVRKGVNLYTFRSKGVPTTYQDKYRTSPRFSVIYSGGDVTVYQRR